MRVFCDKIMRIIYWTLENWGAYNNHASIQCIRQPGILRGEERMKKRLLTLLLALGMLAGIAGCSNTPDAAATPAPSQGAEASGTGDAENSGTGEIDTEATLVIPVTADVVSLNMLQNCLRDTGLTMLGSMYDPFFTLNEDGSLNYYICENMEISEDGTEYVMTLRDDVTWHDGEPLTAEDVIFTFNALANGDLNVCILYGHTPVRYLTGKDEILLYPRDGAAKGSRNIADYCKVHLDTGVALSGVLGCIAVNICQCFYVNEK